MPTVHGLITVRPDSLLTRLTLDGQYLPPLGIAGASSTPHSGGGSPDSRSNVSWTTYTSFIERGYERVVREAQT